MYYVEAKENFNWHGFSVYQWLYIADMATFVCHNDKLSDIVLMQCMISYMQIIL